MTKRRIFKFSRKTKWFLLVFALYLLVAISNRSMLMYRNVACCTRLKSIGSHFPSYQNNHHGYNPSSLQELIRQYPFLTTESAFCPLSKKPYIYRGDDLKANSPQKMIIIYEAEPTHRDTRRLINLFLFDIISPKLSSVLFTGESDLGIVLSLTPKELENAIQYDNELRKSIGLHPK